MNNIKYLVICLAMLAICSINSKRRPEVDG